MFVERCNLCGLCRSACPFLEQYGTPGEILTRDTDDVFCCANCGACDSLCPEGLEPSRALFEAKERRVASGMVPEGVRSALAGARGFAATGHRFPFSHYDLDKSVFWPGCGLAGENPALIGVVRKQLAAALGGRVGLVLDCCFDPLYQLGDTDAVAAAIAGLQERLKMGKVEQLVTGCVNCQKVFSRYLDRVRVVHALQILPLRGGREGQAGDAVFLHHPCYASKMAEVQERARDLLQAQGLAVVEPAMPCCCGSGGGLDIFAPELAQRFAMRALKQASDRPVITYCMGCKGRFSKQGKEVRHVLEMQGGMKSAMRPITRVRAWANRLALSLGEKLKGGRMAAGLVMAMLIVVSLFLRQKGYLSIEGMIRFLELHRIAAPLVFILFYAVGPSLLIPAIPFTLAAGFLWGPLWGTVFSLTGATVGACFPFLIARYVMGDRVKARFGEEKWLKISRIVERHGWKAVAFARLVPLFPYNVLNYIFGITPIPFRDYLWATAIFMLPGCVAFVAFGTSLEGAIKGNLKGLITGIVLAAAALLLSVLLKPLFRKVFHEGSGPKSP
jgi:uncharacterized membrane protein YdjX (TVP38/TMEM64 family)